MSFFVKPKQVIDMKILVMNGGSSTFKFALFDAENRFPFSTEPIWKKNIEFKKTSKSRQMAIKKALLEVPDDVTCVGHRIVHGGVHFQKPTLITPSVKKAVGKLSHLAPLHNPINLEGIEIAETIFPKAKQIGIFDTAFHATMPEVAWTYPGPWKWREEGIRRYGFHGISHHYCTQAVQHLMRSTPKKLITCHLGNGSSCAALLKGKVIDTTMGFTPMEGLMMGTRSGSIDPGILIYLLREQKLSVEALDDLLNKQSGLLGIGGTFDMREILARVKKKDPRALLAFNLYVYRLKLAIGSLAAALDGLNVLCFTGGIGENASEVRLKAAEGLKYLGVKIDRKKNLHCASDGEISSKDSAVKVFVIHVREDWMIAKQCLETML